ncbi:helix-turn-helix domain-containing protein [Actinocrinis puniceicyclus]|uniref:Helix-turn-helix domain-containing protein n=1 Tax=Actinocrinis puniceicyclus TaxID=977794 RepID=A0A8J8BER6_9ACTN|nr:helix-turn-helix domain-containing protein [Actinocrinis puniceicyclus]MBS2965436.1 helix-turn-helix domain-containing protein [Actinocrinis puniceicyclus]
MILIRRLLGEVLRRKRQDEGRTLRQLAAEARISPGYLSEIERGQKEPSSELLAAICDALDIKLSDLLREVSVDLAAAELAARIEAERVGASVTGSVPQARVGATAVKSVALAKPVARTVARPGARPAPRPVTRRVPPPVGAGSAPLPGAVLAAQGVLDPTRLGDAPTVPTKTAASRAAMGPMTPVGPATGVGFGGVLGRPVDGEIVFAFPLMNLGDLALR